IQTNWWQKPQGKITSDQFLVEPQCWATLDYATLESLNVKAEVNWTAARNGIGHGLVLWFDSVLVDGVSFSNAPGGPELIYGSAFFPWPEPVNIAVGDTVFITLQANLVENDYVWRWDTCLLDQGRAQRIKAKFNQSTFLCMPLSSARLRKWAT